MAVSDLTYKVLAYREVPNFNTDDCVNWATEMIALGYDTEHLLILSGLTKPTNFFETIKYLQAAINELGLEFRNGDKGVLSCSTYYIKQIARFAAVKENLSKVYYYAMINDRDKLMFDFSLLYWAWSDIDRGCTVTEYWPEANKDNMEQIVIDVADKWLSNLPAGIDITI